MHRCVRASSRSCAACGACRRWWTVRLPCKPRRRASRPHLTVVRKSNRHAMRGRRRYGVSCRETSTRIGRAVHLSEERVEYVHLMSRQRRTGRIARNGIRRRCDTANARSHEAMRNERSNAGKRTWGGIETGGSPTHQAVQTKSLPSSNSCARIHWRICARAVVPETDTTTRGERSAARPSGATTGAPWIVRPMRLG